MPQSEKQLTSRQWSRRRFLRLTAGAGLSTVAVTLLQACAPAPQAAPTTAAAAKQAAPATKSLLKVRFIITQGALGDWAPYVAREKNFFEEEGVDLEFNIVGDFPSVQSALTSGRSDVTTSSIPFVVSAVLQGAPLKLTMATQLTTPQSKYNPPWCSLPGSPLQKPADLKGKKVHILSPNTLTQALARTMLRKVGVIPGEYEEVSFTFDQSYTALKSNRADTSVFIEPFLSNANKLARDEYGKDMQIIFTFLDLFPNGVHHSGMMANTNFMAQNGDAMRRFHRAQSRAAKWGMENPDEAKRIIAKAAQVPHDNIKDMNLPDHSVDGKWIPGFVKQMQEYLIVEKTMAGLTAPIADDKLIESAYHPTA